VTPRNLFRFLVVLAGIAGALYGYGFSTIENYPESWRSVPDLLRFETWVWFALGPIFALLHLVAYVGLFLFWSPARTLLLVYLFGSVLLGAFLDYPQMPGWVQSFDRLDMALLGLIVGLMYLPPFGPLFGRSARSNSTLERDGPQAARPSA
jgi:hypothetical protein